MTSHDATTTSRNASASVSSAHRGVKRGEMIGLWALLAVSFGAAFVPATLTGSLSLLIGLVPVAFAM